MSNTQETKNRRRSPLAKPISNKCASLSQAAASEVVQATVSAHISAVCAGALRHLDEIIASTATAVSTPDAKSSPALPPVSDTNAAIQKGHERSRVGPAGEELIGNITSGEGSGGAGGGAHYTDRSQQQDVHDCGGEKDGEVAAEGGAQQAITREGGDAGRTEDSDRDCCTPVAAAIGTANAEAASSTLLDLPGTTAVGAAATDGNDNEHWWEEDEEEERERDEEHNNSTINRFWTGPSVRADKVAGGGEGGEADGGCWLRRRGREAPFLRLLVGSQVGRSRCRGRWSCPWASLLL